MHYIQALTRAHINIFTINYGTIDRDTHAQSERNTPPHPHPHTRLHPHPPLPPPEHTSWIRESHTLELIPVLLTL